jgi:hypothetical protein
MHLVAGIVVIMLVAILAFVVCMVTLGISKLDANTLGMVLLQITGLLGAPLGFLYTSSATSTARRASDSNQSGQAVVVPPPTDGTTQSVEIKNDPKT